MTLGSVDLAWRNAGGNAAAHSSIMGTKSPLIVDEHYFIRWPWVQRRAGLARYSASATMRSR
jgi:hypothetical protein